MLSQCNYGSASCFLFCFTYLQLVSWRLNADAPAQGTKQAAKATDINSEAKWIYSDYQIQENQKHLLMNKVYLNYLKKKCSSVRYVWMIRMEEYRKCVFHNKFKITPLHWSLEISTEKVRTHIKKHPLWKTCKSLKIAALCLLPPLSPTHPPPQFQNTSSPGLGLEWQFLWTDHTRPYD